MDYNLVTAMAIGLLVFGATYLILDVVFPSRDETVRRVKLIFAGAGPGRHIAVEESPPAPRNLAASDVGAHRHSICFAGIAPCSDPRALIVAVIWVSRLGPG